LYFLIKNNAGQFINPPHFLARTTLCDPPLNFFSPRLTPRRHGDFFLFSPKFEISSLILPFKVEFSMLNVQCSLSLPRTKNYPLRTKNFLLPFVSSWFPPAFNVLVHTPSPVHAKSDPLDATSWPPCSAIRSYTPLFHRKDSIPNPTCDSSNP